MSDKTETRRMIGCGANQDHQFYIEPDSKADAVLETRVGGLTSDECPHCLEEKCVEIGIKKDNCECNRIPANFMDPDHECAQQCIHAAEEAELPKKLQGLTTVPFHEHPHNYVDDDKDDAEDRYFEDDFDDHMYSKPWSDGDLYDKLEDQITGPNN